MSLVLFVVILWEIGLLIGGVLALLAVIVFDGIRIPRAELRRAHVVRRTKRAIAQDHSRRIQKPESWTQSNPPMPQTLPI